jgi:hypothetical protein
MAKVSGPFGSIYHGQGNGKVAVCNPNMNVYPGDK